MAEVGTILELKRKTEWLSRPVYTGKYGHINVRINLGYVSPDLI